MSLLKVRKSHESAILPTYATEGAGCFDLYSCKDVVLKQNRITEVPTGLSFEVGRDYFVELRPRSGLTKEGILLANSPATLDSDYRGEIVILLHSLYKDWKVFKGNRVAQGRVVWSEPAIIKEVKALSSTRRGQGGFGSTGR